MSKDEKNTERKRKLDIDEIEKVTGGNDNSNGLPPTVPEKDIDSKIKDKI